MGISYRRHRFPPIVIQHAVWLYLVFMLSYRDIEDLLAERGLDAAVQIGSICTALPQHASRGPLHFQPLQRHLVSRSTLRIFRAEAASERRNAAAAV
jgi:hypothetical protein